MVSELETKSREVMHSTSSSPIASDDAPRGGEYTTDDLAVPGVVANLAALLPWVDHDHDDAPTQKTTRTRKAKRTSKPRPTTATGSSATRASTAPATNTAATATASTAPAASAKDTGLPADVAEKMAALNASVFNAALMVHGKNGDRNSQYAMMHVLESADDALTRKKMKEQFAAHTNGSLTDFLGKHTWDSAHGKEQALDLVSDKRDAATDKLAAMSPDKRADLEDKAAGWADKILNVTRGTERDNSENADKIAAILGPRSPEEIEVIRKRIRLQTSGTKSTTVFEELDRTFTEHDESIAMTGLGSDPVRLAQTQLADAAAESDPDRIHAIAKQLGPESMWQLHASDPMLAGRVIASMPEERRGEFSALMNGKQDVADGARIAAMFAPVELSTSDALNGSAAQKMKQKEAQDPERLIAELSKSSPAELAAARKAWKESGNGKSWDALIAERFSDADPTVRMRIESAANGDVVGEKALRLRQGMKTFDQTLIDGALANPDLQSADPKKRAAAQAERRALEERIRLHDANERRTSALMQGKSADDIEGRNVDEQLFAYYDRRAAHDSGSGDSGITGMVTNAAGKDDRMAKTRERASVDRYAAMEMWDEGDAQLSTKVRRAELSGDTTKKAEILEQAKKGTIASHDTDYQRKFGAERSMLANPDAAKANAAAKLLAQMTGDERPTEEIAADLARENMNVGELRMQHVRETGALADRTRDQRIAQQTELRDLSESGHLAGEEQMRFALGHGNRGSEDLHASNLALLQQSGGAGVDDREFQRRDTSTSKALELQRDEKKKSAAKMQQALSIAGKIAALLTANPALFIAVDASFAAARIAAQELIAGEAYDASDDIKHMAVDMAVNIFTARLASLGKGVEAGTQAAKNVQTMQRVGNAGAAMGGAAAHAVIDGGDAGGAVLRAGVGAVLPGYFRGKAENAIKGTSRGASLAREGLGTAVDTAANVAIGGGNVDVGTAVDLIGGTVQRRPHGGRPTGVRASGGDENRVEIRPRLDHDPASPARDTRGWSETYAPINAPHVEMVHRGRALIPPELEKLVHPSFTPNQQQMLAMLDARSADANLRLSNPALYDHDPRKMASIVEEIDRIETSRANVLETFERQRQKTIEQNRPRALQESARLHETLVGEVSPSTTAAAAAIPISPSARSTIARVRGDENAVRQDVADFMQLTGTTPDVALDHDRARANYVNRGASETSTVNLGRSPQRKTIFHELGHGTEYDNPSVAAAATSFRDARARYAANGNIPTPTRLKELDPRGDYLDAEVGVEGGFTDKYTGRVYATGETEVVSTGVEALVDSKRMLKLYESDPEHLELVLGILATLKGNRR
ncbi:MAG: hypothetical protein ACKV2T_08535 [Kofleriaceae bacterium]